MCWKSKSKINGFPTFLPITLWCCRFPTCYSPFIVRLTLDPNYFSFHHLHGPHDLVSLYTPRYPYGTVAAGVADNHRTKYDIELNDDDLLSINWTMQICLG